jgi:hypothetical protein
MQKSLSDFKNSVYAHCLQMLDLQNERLQLAVERTRDALNSETKNTAGDKHETGRAMIQLEQEKLAQQLEGLNKSRQLLKSLPVHITFDVIEAGALAKTSMGYFFIAVGIGKEIVEDEEVYVVAPTAPMAQAMLGKRKGESIKFNKQTILIEEVV